MKIQGEIQIKIKKNGLSAAFKSNFLENNISRLASTDSLLIKIERVYADRTDLLLSEEEFVDFDEYLWKISDHLSHGKSVLSSPVYLVSVKEIGSSFFGDSETLIEQLSFIAKARIAHKLDILDIIDERKEKEGEKE